MVDAAGKSPECLGLRCMRSEGVFRERGGGRSSTRSKIACRQRFEPVCASDNIESAAPDPADKAALPNYGGAAAPPYPNWVGRTCRSAVDSQQRAKRGWGITVARCCVTVQFAFACAALAAEPASPWETIAPLFEAPTQYAGQLGSYRSPLNFADGTQVKTPDDWSRRREELLREWHDLMGPWPPVMGRPRFEVLNESRRENFTQRRVRVEVATNQFTDGWLLVPDGDGPFPAVFVPFYEPETNVGLNDKVGRDFALQLTRRGFVTLSIGTPAGDAWKPDRGPVTSQPLSYYAYVAAHCWTALSQLPEVDAKRIGVVGHSYGGKWALFAGALWDKFTAVAVSDPGIVFDETRSNVNYWEPWYLGLDPTRPRTKAGAPTADNPRTGPYKSMIETGRDLHELHALVAPRPFFVSGGSEDPPVRWIALNHAVAVNQLLGFTNRVGMSNRPKHDPTLESNAQLVAFFEYFLGPGSSRGDEALNQSAFGTLRSAPGYFPTSESRGGWRKLESPDAIRRLAGLDPVKLDELAAWLKQSDERNFAAVVIRNGYIVLEVARGNSAKTDSRRVASVSKAICATVLAIAAERSRRGLTPRKMTFDDPAFDFIPWAQPLSDPRKARITVKQLLNHTSGICPEATGARNDGTWDYILGHTGDPRTEKLAFDPGTACGYSSHALMHAALVCETVTGKPYDEFAIEALFKPLGIEHWWFQYYDDGGEKIGRHPSHGLGMPARDLARIGYCMLRNGRWNTAQVIPEWFVTETAQATHDVRSPEMRWGLNAQVFSHGWELPAVHRGEDGRSGEGIPADARSKPGSGGQLIAFVPSLDLVITRQTGSSGAWQYEEYVRRVCAAVIAEAE